MKQISNTLQLRFLYPGHSMFLLRVGNEAPLWWRTDETHIDGDIKVMAVWDA